jgi:hypothetical protein
MKINIKEANAKYSKPYEKKVLKYKLQVLAFASILVCLHLSSGWKEFQAIAKQACVKPIGRVYSPGDLNLPVGSQICPRGRINPIKGRTVTALCYLNGKFLNIKHSSVFDTPDMCAPPQTSMVCTGRNPDRCNNVKGPGEEQNVPTIISPYGSSMLSTRPSISWYGVADVTSYTVTVSGYEFYWEKTVDKAITSLSYPKEEQQLQFGNTYKFTVLANKGDTPISSSEPLVVSILPQEEQDAIAQRVKQINQLNLPPDEAAIWDKDAVYMSRHLLNETIETLKAIVAAGSQNPTVYRLLADRYLEAWLPDEAFREYTKAAQLAKTTGNSDELARVQEGLKLVEWYNR